MSLTWAYCLTRILWGIPSFNFLDPLLIKSLVKNSYCTRASDVVYVYATPENWHTNTSSHHNAFVTHSDIFQPAVVSTAESCLMRHQGLTSCHINRSGTPTVQSPYRLASVIWTLTLVISVCCSFQLCHYSSNQPYWHVHSLCPYFSFLQSLSFWISLSSLPLSHNHLTPLRASAETSFTPQSSLWQQVLLALTAWPLSNQHLLRFIPISSLPLSPPFFLPLPPFSIDLSLAFVLCFPRSTCSEHFDNPCHFLPFVSFTIMNSNRKTVHPYAVQSYHCFPVMVVWYLRNVHSTPLCFHIFLYLLIWVVTTAWIQVI